MKRLLLLALTLSVFAIPALCQCEDEGDTLNWTDGFVREDGNTLYYSAYAYVTGGEDEWYEYVSATGLNSNSDEEFSPAVAEVYWTNTLQLIGPGTYSEIAEFEFEDDDDEACDYDPPNDTQQIVIQRPTISGFCCGNAFWNLGPGTADPQPTLPPGGGSGAYTQSAALTFVSNCPECTSTPTWNLSVSYSQTQLPGGATTATGSTTTISKGTNNYASCLADSVLTASIDGFSSDDYAVTVNGPDQAYNISYGGVPFQNTYKWLPTVDGYTTDWSLGILDDCGTQYLYPLPVAESFSGLGLENMATGYSYPPGASDPYWDYTDWANEYIFIDQIGQCGTGCGGTPYPIPTYTSSTPPYSYSTIYLDGSHYLKAGSTSYANGIDVYSGTIQYFQDHGDNNP